MTTFSMTEVCHLVMRDGITCYIEHTGGGILTLFAGAKTADGLWTVAAGPGRYTDIIVEGEMDAVMLSQAGITREAVGNTESFSVGQGGTSFTRTEDLWTCPELATVAEIADEIIHQVREHAVQTPVVTPEVKTWPETEAEKYAFTDWQYEVGNGDTLRGFRDWLDVRNGND
jgi:hypothetical protein